MVYQRLTGFVASFYSFQQFWSLEAGFHYVTFLSDVFWLSTEFLSLDCWFCDHVITRFASVGIRARLRKKIISSLYYFSYFQWSLSFSMFASIFLFFVSTSSKQKKKKEVIFHLVTVESYQYIKRERERERERERPVEISRMIQFLPQKNNFW